MSTEKRKYERKVPFTALQLTSRKRNEKFYRIQAIFATLRGFCDNASRSYFTEEEIDDLYSAFHALQSLLNDRAKRWEQLKKQPEFIAENQPNSQDPARELNTPIEITLSGYEEDIVEHLRTLPEDGWN